MRVALVTINIKPEFRDRLMEESVLEAQGSVQNEPGCIRFDILQDDQDPNRVYLYEVYRDAAAEEAHLQTPHFLRWDKATRDWFASPYEIAECEIVYPEEAGWVPQA